MPSRSLTFALIFAALPAALFGASRSPASVVISEIMFNPQGTDKDLSAASPYDREWVEIFNTGSSAIDVSGWQFGDIQDNEWASPFPANTILPPHSALVVTGDAASFDLNWGFGINRIQVSGFPTLANSVGTNEGAAIRNNAGVLQDVVRFQETEWPTANGSDGNSIYAVPQGLNSRANDSPTTWKPASQGVYGAWWTNRRGLGENHGSPGVVVTEPQAPFALSPDAVWSMAIIPDSQNYAKSSVNRPIFSQMTAWVRDNREAFNIQLVMHEGDIVNQNSQVQPTSGDQTADQQWANARQAMSILDGHLPYIMAVGNHDIGTTNAQSRDTQFNDYFNPQQNPLVDPAQGGILKGLYSNSQLENAYFELQAPDGRNLLIFSLEYWPRQEVLDWANNVAARPQYENYTAVLLTHSYMNWDEDYWRTGATVGGLGTNGNDGEDMWHELVKLHGNFEMTFNGHVGGDGVGYLASPGVEGNTVHQMLLNTQFETNGGNGWMRVLEFLDDGKTVRVRTYSPFLDLYRTDPANDFYITLSELPSTPGDFNADGLVDSADLDVWTANYGMTSGATRTMGDANGDGAVDGKDFLAWQTALTGASTASGSAIPEPTAAALAICVVAAVYVQRRGFRR